MYSDIRLKITLLTLNESKNGSQNVIFRYPTNCQVNFFNNDIFYPNLTVLIRTAGGQRAKGAHRMLSVKVIRGRSEWN